jgi:hypothetical protein
MMALPLKAIAPPAAKSKPDMEERLAKDIRVSLFSVAHAQTPDTSKNADFGHASD